MHHDQLTIKAIHVDPVSHTLKLVDLSRKTADLAALFQTNPFNIAMCPLQAGDRPTDLLIVADRPAKGAGSFFMLKGLPSPVNGDAYIIGVSDSKPVEGSAGLCRGEPAECPNVGLDWVQDNIVWLRPAPQHSHDGIMAFEAVNVSPGTILNILNDLREQQARGEVALTAEELTGPDIAVGGRIVVDHHRDSTNDPNALESVIKAVRSKLH